MISRLLIRLYEVGWNILLVLAKFLPQNHNLSHWYNQRLILPSAVNLSDSQYRLLFACSSVGEYKRIETLAKHYKAFGNHIEISFFSPSGIDFLAEQHHPWDQISYLPFDTRKHVDKFLNPRKLNYVLISSNMIWPNFIRGLDERKVNYSMIGCTYQRKGFIQKMILDFRLGFLKNVDFAFCIDIPTTSILSKHLLPDQIVLSGDPRLKSILNTSSTSIDMTFLRKFKKDKKLLICGSAYTTEVAIIIKAYDVLKQSGYQIIIAPHILDDTKNIYDQLRSSGISAGLYSEKNLEKEVLLLDTMGMLKDSYSMAEIVFVGGGWNKGTHNIVEAMIYNCTIVTGPKFEKFPEAIYLNKEDVLCIVHGSKEFECIINQEEYSSFQERKKEIYQTWISDNAGANDITIERLNISKSK